MKTSLLLLLAGALLPSLAQAQPSAQAPAQTSNSAGAALATGQPLPPDLLLNFSPAARNEALLLQSGTGNAAYLNQANPTSPGGRANLAAITQAGAGNVLAVQQTGAGNGVRFAQAGTANQATLRQTGTGNDLDGQLSGNYNQLSVAQTGTGNRYSTQLSGTQGRYQVEQLGTDNQLIQRENATTTQPGYSVRMAGTGIRLRIEQGR